MESDIKKKIDINQELKWSILFWKIETLYLPRIFADNKEESYWLISNLKSKDLETETTLQHDRCKHFDLVCPEEALLLLLS